MISSFQSTFHASSERGQHQGSSGDEKYNDKDKYRKKYKDKDKVQKIQDMYNIFEEKKQISNMTFSAQLSSIAQLDNIAPSAFQKYTTSWFFSGVFLLWSYKGDGWIGWMEISVGTSSKSTALRC